MNLSHTVRVMSFKRTLSIVGLSSSLVGFASAEIESSISAGYNSQYVYRGVDFGDDQSTLSLGASGNAGDLNWSIGLFHGSSEDATNLGGAAGASLDETRIHAGVSTGLSDCLSVSAGIINTSYNLLPSDRLEVYVGAATSVSGIDVSATAYFNESDNYTGDTYYELGASKSFDVAENVTGTLAVTYGNWNKDPLGGAVSDVDFLSVSGTLNIDLGDNVGASIGVTHSSSDTALTEDQTVVGTSLTLGF
ncbi:hypothetical protein N8515_01910 [bacterium]|nr:hypothetical protein [bacterium]MDB4741297.1 hypothetical protein [Akkermansiaceae bacterium]MDB4786053.1 hypothetical protein [bacterium]